MKNLNYKYLAVSVFFSFLFMTAIPQKSETTKIKGKISNGNNKTIYILEYGKTVALIDSALISKSGDFLLKPNLKETGIYQLKFNDTIKLMLVLTPGENLNLTTDIKNVLGSLSIKGSPDSKLIYETQKKVQVYVSKIDSLNSVYIQNKDKPNVNELVPQLQKEYNKVIADQKEFVTNTILNNLNSLACLFFIDKLDFTLDFPVYFKLDSSLYKKYPGNIFVGELHNKVSEAMRLAIGSIAPDINLPDTSGNLVPLSSLRGKVVLIDFWASWCGPCKKEIPKMRQIYKKFKGKDFEIYGVSLDKFRTSWTNCIKNDSLNWIHVSDLKYWQCEAAAVYKVGGIPYTVLIDKEGKIIAKELRGEALEAKLDEMFKNNK